MSAYQFNQDNLIFLSFKCDFLDKNIVKAENNKTTEPDIISAEFLNLLVKEL